MPIRVVASGRVAATSRVAAIGRSASSARDPLVLPTTNLRTYLSADAGTFQDAARLTPAVATGDPVGGWADQSAVGTHFSQATANLRPTLQLNVQNGRPVVRFAGLTPTWLRTAAFSGLQVKTVVLVFSQTDNGHAQQYPFDGQVSNSTQLNFGVAPTNMYRIHNGVNVSWTAYLPSGFRVFTAVYNGTSSAAYVNGVQKATGQAGSNTTTQWVLGTRGDLGVAQAATMDVAAFLVYSGALSAGARTQVEHYLGAYWAVGQSG